MIDQHGREGALSPRGFDLWGPKHSSALRRNEKSVFLKIVIGG